MRARPKPSARLPRAQHIVAAVVPALIVTLSITGFVWAQKAVTVVVDGRTVHMKTQAASVAALLDDAGIAYQSGDLVTPAPDTQLTKGEVVVVRHSVPITLELGGTTVKVDVVGESVADALVAAGADPSASPSVTPSLGARLVPNMVISAPDAFVRVHQREARIVPVVRYQPDPSLPKGTKRVVTTGRPGKKLQVFRVLVMNGAEGTPVLSAQRVLRPALPRIVAVGSAAPKRSFIAAASAAERDITAPDRPPAGGRRMRVVTTGYSAQEPELDDWTATGAKARHGVIAVDPRVIPLGTHVYIPGYGPAVAADTGGAIHGRRVDLCFDTVRECIQWGRRRVTIIILD